MEQAARRLAGLAWLVAEAEQQAEESHVDPEVSSDEFDHSGDKTGDASPYGGGLTGDSDQMDV